MGIINKLLILTLLIEIVLSVSGGWGDFGDFSECTVACGGGEQFRIRKCDNPLPQHGGVDCEGEERETRACNVDACPKKIFGKNFVT